MSFLWLCTFLIFVFQTGIANAAKEASLKIKKPQGGTREVKLSNVVLWSMAHCRVDNYSKHIKVDLYGTIQRRMPCSFLDPVCGPWLCPPGRCLKKQRERKERRNRVNRRPVYSRPVAYSRPVVTNSRTVTHSHPVTTYHSSSYSNLGHSIYKREADADAGPGRRQRKSKNPQEKYVFLEMSF